MAAPSAVPALIPAVSSASPDLQSILDINRAAYDTLARTYKGTAAVRQENAKKWLIQRLPEITTAGQPTALDVGCADGTHSRVLSALGYTVTGVDFSAQMISADLVLATAFVHLFPPDADDDAVPKVLGHVAPGGTALLSTTAAMSNRRGLELKAGAGGQVARRWRNHCTLEYFVWLVREAARDVYGVRVPVRPWVVLDAGSEGKLWVDVVVTRPA
jgi:SAM-dependent methyltransferase